MLYRLAVQVEIKLSLLDRLTLDKGSRLKSLDIWFDFGFCGKKRICQVQLSVVNSVEFNSPNFQTFKKRKFVPNQRKYWEVDEMKGTT